MANSSSLQTSTHIATSGTRAPAILRTLQWIAGAGALVSGIALGLRGAPFIRYAVEGPSMEPSYHGGDRLIVSRLAYLFRGPSAGDVVVVRDPEMRSRHLVKRIDAVLDNRPGQRRYFLIGDNAAESRDSRHFGAVTQRHIVGRVWFRY